MNCEVCKKPRECIIGSFYADCKRCLRTYDLDDIKVALDEWDCETPVIPTKRIEIGYTTHSDALDIYDSVLSIHSNTVGDSVREWVSTCNRHGYGYSITTVYRDKKGKYEIK